MIGFFQPNVMQLCVMGDYDGVFGTGQTLVQCGPIEFFVRGADQLYLDLNNSKLEIKLKITLKNGNELTARDGFGPLNDILSALIKSLEMELGGVLFTDPQ